MNLHPNLVVSSLQVCLDACAAGPESTLRVRLEDVLSAEAATTSVESETESLESVDPPLTPAELRIQAGYIFHCYYLAFTPFS
jgi:hypothetical protein